MTDRGIDPIADQVRALRDGADEGPVPAIRRTIKKLGARP